MTIHAMVPLHIGHAADLKGRERRIYRLLEIFPGALSWGTILGMFVASWLVPVGAAVFIIIFDAYWLVKTVYLSVHLRASWKMMRKNLTVDWTKKLSEIGGEHLWQLVILPLYTEPEVIVRGALHSLEASHWPKERMIIALSVEERAGADARIIAERLIKEYSNVFPNLLFLVHPDGRAGELAGKGANIAWAADEVRKSIIDTKRIPHEHIIVSAFDIDTHVYPQYFECLACHFLTAKNPHRASYQPVPLYNNNIWDAPAFSRVVAISGTFWQLMQQVRPERLTTFSSHSMSFKTLVELGYWQKNVVSEDSRIFWNAFLHYDGDYEVIPLSYPVSMDANLAPTLKRTAKNVYRQQRRWTWGVENLPYILYGFLHHPRIPFGKKMRMTLTQLEGFWSLATNPLLIFFLGWLPLAFGGDAFNATLLAYMLPRVTRTLMTIAMLGLIGSATLTLMLLPPRPGHKSSFSFAFMVLQWILVPVSITVFGAIPGLEAQTRLMFGKYLGFWVTPKYRSQREPEIRSEVSDRSA